MYATAKDSQASLMGSSLSLATRIRTHCCEQESFRPATRTHVSNPATSVRGGCAALPILALNVVVPVSFPVTGLVHYALLRTCEVRPCNLVGHACTDGLNRAARISHPRQSIAARHLVALDR